MEMYSVKKMVKEALDELFSMEEGKKAKNRYKKRKEKDDEKDKSTKKKSGDGGKKDYTDVRRAFEKLGGPSMVDVMILTGIPDDEKGVNRSLFRKKVKQIKNKDTGSYYQFDDEELNQVRAALDIKS
jgi:hypothetical protein